MIKTRTEQQLEIFLRSLLGVKLFQKRALDGPEHSGACPFFTWLFGSHKLQLSLGQQGFELHWSTYTDFIFFNK